MSSHQMKRYKVRSGVVVLAIVAVTAGCGTEPVTTPAGSASPQASTGASTVPSVIPTAAPSPAPTRLPATIVDHWVAAGSTVRAYGHRSQLVALPGGGAVLLGMPLDAEGMRMDGVLATERWDPVTGWHEGASTDGREAYVAVALGDGRVLVAGGGSSTRTSLATASIYDPSSETWSDVAPMAQARTHPAAALLPDGRVLVVGGFAWDPNRALGRASRMNPEPAATARLGLPGGAGVPLLDIAVPPYGPALATAEVFDPTSGTWSETGPMRFARTGPAIATLTDGRVLVAGADGEPTRIDARAYSTAEAYDPAAGRFSSAGALPGIDRELIAGRGVQLPEAEPEPGPAGTLVALPDGGGVLVAREVSWKHEGEVVWSARIDPDLVTWRAVGEPFGERIVYGTDGEDRQVTGMSRLGAIVVGLGDGSILVAGGSPGYSVPPPARAPVSAERYDPTSDAWRITAGMPEPRDAPLGIRLADGTVLVVGGVHDVGEGQNASTEWAAEAYRYQSGPMPAA